MSSLEKRHTGRRGSTHGHHKCSDGFSDTSSVGSLMDETDREVSNLTDRAFRSLCIGEDAIYNDLEVSTPTECQTAFVQEGEQKKDLKLTHQENASHGVQYSTFQHSCQDVAQEQGLRDESLAYVSNGSIEATYQQRRSSSSVSSLIKAFSDNGAPDVQQSKDKYKDDSWDKSALLSIQSELSEFSSAYHHNFKSYGNHYHQESTSLMTSSKIKFKSLNYTNFFCHSEFSPFQLWKDYNRFPFEREQASGFISASDFPRWYNSPLYKELTASHRITASPFESRQLDHRQIEDIASSQHSRFTVIQKASAIEKRCESELASNCPPWKRNNNLVRNKLPSNRPSTVSPTNEKAHRPDSSLLYYSKNTYDIQQQVRKVSSSEISSSSTPFNITQLLTPVIHKRQDTETSEILQLAHTPLVSDYSPQRETDRKSLPDVKQLRDSYKSKAPSLLFNLKDNRKRVKSTYSPPKFKGLELSDRNRQSSKLEDLADTALFKENQQEQYAGTTDVITEDEPVIFSISISSLSDTSPDTTKVQLEENKQVRQEGQTIQKELKKNGDERALHKNVENEIVQVKCKNDKQLLPGINPDDTNERSTVTGNTLHNNPPHFNSKISVTVSEETKTKVRGQDKRVQDVPLIQNSQISSNQRINTADSKLQYRTQEACARDAVKPEKPSKDPNLTKDNNTSQNNRTDTICNKESLEQEQAKLMISKETKHIRNEASTLAYKQIKGTVDCSGNENVITNVSVAQNTHQGVLPVLKLDKHILQNNSVNVQNKTINPRATADLPKNADKNAISIPSKTKDSTQRLENEKWKSEESKNERNEISTVNKENALRALSLNKTEKVAECEFTKSVNRKETIAKPQDENKPCYDQPAMINTDQARKDTRQRTEVRANKDEHSTNINVYQYHPLKGFIPEIKENIHDKVTSTGSNHDTVLKKQEGTLIKTKDTQNERKAIKPEISALADYARLKVISAEADSSTEKDILLKMNSNHKYNLSVGEPQNLPTEQIKKTTANKYESESETTMPLQVHERHNHTFKRDKIKEGLLEGHNECPPRDKIIPHPKSRSLAKTSDDGQFAVRNRDISRAGHAESNTATHSNEKCYGDPNNHKTNPTQNTHVAQNSVLQVEVKSKNDALPKLKQPVNVKTIGKDVNTESSSQSSMDSIHNNKINIQEDRRAHVPPETKDGETTEELQYYIVNALEKEPKPKVTHEPVPLRQKVDSKKAPEIPATGPRSNTSSPAMGKPIMFKVKDNTNKTSSVTKTVRPRFHRSFSQELRVSSPNEVWCGAEKNRFDQEREHDPKISANHSVLHEPSVALYRVPKAKEIQSRNNLFSPGAKELKSYNKRSQVVEDDTRSVISTMSEDVESRAASTVIMADATTSQGFDIDRRNTYARPESSCYERPESVCYDRPESACYERPESACSDMRSLSKPPVVPPKTDKALRRAQKLTTRRIKKAEVKMASDTRGQTETTPIRNVSSMPSSPMEHMVTHQPAQASPPISHYHVQPNYASPASSLMAHSFPITQRKLLQDPNSGQYFMVDMPMQVKTKTFFDPETGKYLQLNVRQNPQSTQSTPVEVLGHSYVVYPGFLPMSVSVSSVPSLRSSSQMSAPATIQEEQNKLEAGCEPNEQENYQTEDHRNVQQYNVPMYGTHEQKMHSGNNVRLTPRRTHIITMSELEDFAVENT
ncbi:uncharacterized protein LOC134315285 [Trichomycterus rosablanca]|uniref:uncharacterized protein LOC134315285 n=1 Tax=Trichomycterus rosablanca TaxID=2290929 RepID=UPI002F360923